MDIAAAEIPAVGVTGHPRIVAMQDVTRVEPSRVGLAAALLRFPGSLTIWNSKESITSMRSHLFGQPGHSSYFASFGK